MDPNGSSPTQLQFSPGALPTSGSVSMEADPASFPWGFQASAEAAATGKQTAQGGPFATPLAQRYLTISDSHHARLDGVLAGAANLSIPYEDKVGPKGNGPDGIVDTVGDGSPTGLKSKGLAATGAKIKVSTLALYRLDEEHQLWIRVPGSFVDTQNQMVRGNIYQLGLYAVMGSPSQEVGEAYAFPVPFVASRDHVINFVNLPDEGQIRIYTAATGELVKTITIDAGHPDPLPWDATNDSGQALGADVYTYQIKAGGNTKTGKLVIVR
jgi:hypothetical protein